MSQEPKLWERQDDESARDYHRFTIFRDLSPEIRSVSAAWRIGRNPDNTAPRPDSGWFRAATKYAWELRAEAHDKHLAELAELRRKSTLAKMEASVCDKAQELLDQLMGMGLGTVPPSSCAARALVDLLKSIGWGAAFTGRHVNSVQEALEGGGRVILYAPDNQRGPGSQADDDMDSEA